MSVWGAGDTPAAHLRPERWLTLSPTCASAARLIAEVASMHSAARDRQTDIIILL
jgi:hypothetical protein